MRTVPPESRPSTARPTVRSRRFEGLALALVLLGTVLLHLPALRTPFFADDYLFLDQVRNRSLWDTLLAPDPLGNFFRPISRQLYFWIMASLTHESPLAFRVGNLVTLLALVVLLWAFVRRLAGSRAAIVAAAFVSLHYAADVPVRWASGSQELLAVAGALAALLLHAGGRRGWAGVAMLFAALSKEVVLLTPVIAMVADRPNRDSWRTTVRQAWPMGVAVGVWAMGYFSMRGFRGGPAASVEFDPVNMPFATLAHLLQVIPGAEWVTGAGIDGRQLLVALLPLALAVAANVLLWRTGLARPLPAAARRSRAHVLWLAGVWVAVAIAPILPVTSAWSAYYYLYAMCGVALLLGVLLERAPSAITAAVIATLGLGSASARHLTAFDAGGGAWASASHINASYIERSNRVTASYLASLQRAHPRLASGSTLYFGGLSSHVAFQRGDGQLLRWAYRDTSLRSYYMYAASKQTARPGPLLFFLASGDTLKEMPQGPELLLRVAFGQVLSDHVNAAKEILDLAESHGAWSPRVSYWRAWLHFALGDTLASSRDLARAGYKQSTGSPGSRERVLEQMAAGDTLRARLTALEAVRAHPLDAGAHGLAADVMLMIAPDDAEAVLEAFAARVLAPRDPNTWYRWAMIQAARNRPLEEFASLQAYFRLGGIAARNDADAQRRAATLRAQLPAGPIGSESLPK